MFVFSSLNVLAWRVSSCRYKRKKNHFFFLAAAAKQQHLFFIKSKLSKVLFLQNSQWSWLMLRGVSSVLRQQTRFLLSHARANVVGATAKLRATTVKRTLLKVLSHWPAPTQPFPVDDSPDERARFCYDGVGRSRQLYARSSSSCWRRRTKICARTP